MLDSVALTEDALRLRLTFSIVSLVENIVISEAYNSYFRVISGI